MKCTVSPGQILILSAFKVTKGVNNGLTMIIEVSLTVGDVRQLALLVITTDKTSPLLNALVIYVLVALTCVPFKVHTYAGFEPPFVGVAWNVTIEPAQIVSVATFLIIATSGVMVPTVIPITFDDEVAVA